MKKMALLKTTARPASPKAVSAEASEGGGRKKGQVAKGQIVSLVFPESCVSQGDLEKYAKDHSWFDAQKARPAEGDTHLKPEPGEVIFVMEHFVVGFRFPTTEFVLGVTQRFNVRFHQMSPGGFVKLAIYAWSCQSQGLEPDVEGFIYTHRVHYQPRILEEDETSQTFGRYRVFSFVHRAGMGLPAQAKRNRWASGWYQHWFYYDLGVDSGLCGPVDEVGEVTATAVMTDQSYEAVDALKTVSRHLCTRDLVEEFICFWRWPLCGTDSKLDVAEDPRHKGRGLMTPVLDFAGTWGRRLKRRGVTDEAVMRQQVLDEVTEAAVTLIGRLESPEIKEIRSKLGDKRRLNRVFDVFGVEYPDWPSVGDRGASVGVKRKRGSSGPKSSGGSGGGRGGGAKRGRRGASVAAKGSRGASASEPIFLDVDPWVTLVDALGVEVDSDYSAEESAGHDDGEESEGSLDDRESLHDRSYEGSYEEEEEEDREEDIEVEEESPREVSAAKALTSMVLRDVPSSSSGPIAAQPLRSSSRQPRNYSSYHIIRDGKEVELTPVSPSRRGKLAFGDGNQYTLPFVAEDLGITDLDAKLFTGPDLRECNLQSNAAERGFFEALMNRVYVPEAEFMLSRQSLCSLHQDMFLKAAELVLLARSAGRREGWDAVERNDKERSLKKDIRELKKDRREWRQNAEANLASRFFVAVFVGLTGAVFKPPRLID